MSTRLSLPLALTSLFVLACSPPSGIDAGTDGGEAVDDAGQAADAGGAHDAGTHLDAGHDDAGHDAGHGDAGANDAGANDAGHDDAGAELDGGIDGIDVDAVLGERCLPEERLGVVELTSWGGESYYALAELFDRPRPWLGPPALSDEACSHYVGASGCSCDALEVCAFGGGCAAAPAAVTGIGLRLSTGTEVQVLEENGTSGLINGEVTLPGSTFSVELFAPDVSVRAASMTVPDALAGGSGDLQGDYMAPTGIDLTWTPPPAGVAVFTHVPMNHHVSTPAFTQCVVDGSASELHIDGAMLSPLAVSTGLEFQTVDTVRSAAAHTERGCVEIRFVSKGFVNLE